MRKILFILFVALMTAVSTQAQQISVVLPDGTTSLHRTLPEAIKAANVDGSVIYLPGGGFPIPDDSGIHKKVTIIGIGHKSDSDNADGVTTISGNLWFDNGSSGSAVMACYITGDVNIGNDGSEVNDVLIRYCNLNQVTVKNTQCKGTFVNQNYVRSGARFNGASGRIFNNVIGWIFDFDNGTVANNIITGYYCDRWSGAADLYSAPLHSCDQTTITNNIILDRHNHGYYGTIHSGSNCIVNGNMSLYDFGDDFINVDGDGFNWKTVFKDYKGTTPASDFHFTDKYKEYDKKVGIYAGSDFNEDQMAPVPYITFKSIPDQTDASGKLNIQIRVKAGK